MAPTASPLEVGFDVPALPGMDAGDIQTPCLILDLEALERNIRKLGDYARAHGIRHRAHGKMHKSVDVLKLQMEIGGAIGVCCQKVSEAEVFARAGIRDILVSNQVCDPLKIRRLARLPKFGGRVIVCVDDIANIADLSAAAQAEATTLDCLVEIDCGANRCGVTDPAEVVALARAIATAPRLRFTGLQAYNGVMQHLPTFAERATRFAAVHYQVAEAIAALNTAGLPPELVSGGGTGSYNFEATSGVYNELQCGSYAFMDADYGRVQDACGARFDGAEWENALFILGQDEDQIIQACLPNYLHPNRPSQSHIVQDVHAEIRRQNAVRSVQGLPPLRMPSASSVRRRITALGRFEVTASREGLEVARGRYGPVGRGLDVEVPLERVFWRQSA
ncbi:MAG TPA: alanine racemase [Paenirhodobacter sp.]